jgi:hypothetical protein
MDAAGRILLREPSGHFDGYVWRFRKGRPEGGETPEETALRETCGEPACWPRSSGASRWTDVGEESWWTG